MIYRYVLKPHLKLFFYYDYYLFYYYYYDFIIIILTFSMIYRYIF